MGEAHRLHLFMQTSFANRCERYKIPSYLRKFKKNVSELTDTFSILVICMIFLSKLSAVFGEFVHDNTVIPLSETYAVGD